MFRKTVSTLMRPSMKLVMPTAKGFPMKMMVRSVVTVEEAKRMPKRYNEMPNDILLSMAVMGDQEAREERLIREIMAVDNVSW